MAICGCRKDAGPALGEPEAQGGHLLDSGMGLEGVLRGGHSRLLVVVREELHSPGRSPGASKMGHSDTPGAGEVRE
jgi:hypothetical protein